jgi:predicted amidohydrolase
LEIVMAILIGTSMSSSFAKIKPGRALALQIKGKSVAKMDVDSARASILATVDRVDSTIQAAGGWLGGDLNIVVLPEYFLSGYPMGDSLPGWAEKGAIAHDGPEYEQLCASAQKNKVFLSGNVYEVDPNFPGIYFQASFIIAPSGDLVHRYRRMHSMFSPSPWDYWDKYTDLYGAENVFPVTHTEFGNLATIASEEIQYPELARALAFKGAEIFLHSTSEVGSPALTPKDVAKRARSFENCAYVVSANSAGLDGSAVPMNSTDGMSKVVDYNGLVLAEAGYGETMNAHAAFDVNALRRTRNKPGLSNTLSRNKSQLWASIYSEVDIVSANALLNNEPQRSFFVERQTNIIKKMQELGINERNQE